MPNPYETTYQFIISHALLLHNTRTVTQMSPYAQLNIGGVIRKTQVHSDSGVHPKWEETLRITSYGGSLLRVEIKDKGIYGYDELIGQGIVDLRLYGLTCDLQENNDYQLHHNLVVDLKNGKETAGQLFMRVKQISKRRQNKVNFTDENRNNENLKRKKGEPLKIFKQIAMSAILNKSDIYDQRIDSGILSLRSQDVNQVVRSHHRKIMTDRNSTPLDLSIDLDRMSQQKYRKKRQEKKTEYIINRPMGEVGIASLAFAYSKNLRY